jgi:hypothetical protein
MSRSANFSARENSGRLTNNYLKRCLNIGHWILRSFPRKGFHGDQH